MSKVVFQRVLSGPLRSVSRIVSGWPVTPVRNILPAAQPDPVGLIVQIGVVEKDEFERED